MVMENRSVYEDNLESSTLFKQQFSTVKSASPDKIPISEKTEHFTPKTQTIFLWTQLFAASAISMGMLLNGFTFGYSYPAATSLLNSTFSQGRISEVLWVCTSMALAASVGGFLGGPFITYVGRKYSLIGVGVPFFIGWILVASASNLHLLLAGRVLSAICAGVMYSAFPVYIAEIVQPELRGALGLLPMAFKNGGIYVAYSISAHRDIFTMAYIVAALSVPFFSLMFVPPESPRWYIAKGRPQNARDALQWLRGKKYNIENEMQDLIQFQVEADKTKGIALKQMFYMENFPAVLISLGLMIFKNLTGMYVVIFYYVQTTRLSDISFKLFYNKIALVSVCSVIIAIILVDRIGRKILLYISSGCVIVSLLTLGVFSYIQVSDDNDFFYTLSLPCLILHTFGSYVGYESIPWLMLGEILPVKTRGTAASLITGITWLCTYYMGTVSNNMVKSDATYAFFFAFAVIHVFAILFVKFCVPETRGKSLEEIENNFTQRVKIINNSGNANADANIK